MDHTQPDLDLHIDMKQIKNHQEYRAHWKKLGRLEIRMVEKHEECKHELGQVFYLDTPYERPPEICHALYHVLSLYTWRAVLGFPSWNTPDRRVYKIHCPDPKGTVWEMRKVGQSQSDLYDSVQGGKK